MATKGLLTLAGLGAIGAALYYGMKSARAETTCIIDGSNTNLVNILHETFDNARNGDKVNYAVSLQRAFNEIVGKNPAAADTPTPERTGNLSEVYATVIYRPSAYNLCQKLNLVSGLHDNGADYEATQVLRALLSETESV